jgi:palmitoyltransferase
MDDRVTKSPYMCGLVSGSVVVVGYVWATNLVHNTPGYAYTNLAFAVALALCAYNLFRAVTLDPAFIPTRPSDQQLKDVRIVGPLCGISLSRPHRWSRN